MREEPPNWLTPACSTRTARRRRPSKWQPAWIQQLVDDGPVDVSVCIANWNCRAHLRACLESLHDQPQGVRLETIVVDNASTDGSPELVRANSRKSLLSATRAIEGFPGPTTRLPGRHAGIICSFSTTIPSSRPGQFGAWSTMRTPIRRSA